MDAVALTAIIAAIAAGALTLLGGLVKLGHSLAEKRRQSMRPPPPKADDVVELREDTGRHQLQVALLTPGADDLHTRLDRIERAMAQLLRIAAKSSQVDSDVAAIAESLDALAQIETLRAHRDELRSRWFDEKMDAVLVAVNERDMATAKALAAEMEARFMMMPRRR